MDRVDRSRDETRGGDAPGAYRSGPTEWLWLVAFVIRNWFWGWTFFLPGFVVNLVGMVTGATVFYFMGQLVDVPGRAAVVDAAGRPGAGFGPYIITGVAFNTLMHATLRTYHQAILRPYWANQLDTYVRHPGGLSACLVGETIANYLVAALNTIVYFAVGAWLFGVAVEVANLPSVLALLALAVASLTGLGLVGASTFTLLDAKSQGPNPVEWLVGFGATLLAGVYFPPSVLPRWLQGLSEWLPQTHALRAARLCLAGQATLADPSVQADAAYLVGFGALSLAAGAWFFAAGMRKAMREGTLTRWS